MELSYAAVIGVFADMHWVAPEGLGAFKARLRKLQGEGVPAGANPGKGKRVAYSTPMILELAVALELIQVGLSPRAVADLIEENRDDLFVACLMAIGPIKNASEPMLLISPSALTFAALDRENRLPYGALSIVTRRKMLGQLSRSKVDFEPVTGEHWRWVVIGLREMMYALLVHWSEVLEPSSSTLTEFLTKLVVDNSAPIREFKKTRLDKMVTLNLEVASDGD
ncbi:hypothetical protein [Altererythrobacter sp. TH136]|uniref:hypothetical protein n=1 Tax=Altererythrobacter sp. TH136 TaxID=2067415 RepID=UPI0011655996|nr:hypothetical protein [Altererythrobacter sp. TH136]QDM40356.1 hypothetical protein C0V74_04315 [Altererythrobacter sp. TH136]